MRLLLAAVALVALAPSAALAAPDPQDVANDVSSEIMSPYCPGVTLHDCPSSESIELRERIVGWAEDGMTEGQIIARLEAQWGPAIRSTPSSDGAGILAWLLPSIALLVGAGAAAYALRRWRGRTPAAQSAGPTISDDDHRRVERELARFREEQ